MDVYNAMSKYDAEADWNRARRKALYQEVSCFFRECSVDLLSFEDVRTDLHLTQKVYRGLQEIPVDQIRGSVGRYDDFTSAFLPRRKHLRERWERVDMVMQTEGVPPIDVYQVGDSYFVLDGNHRVSIAKQHRQDTIEANVWEFPAAAGPGAETEIDEMLVERERGEFLATIGESAPRAIRDTALTCADGYADLVNMLEAYRRGVEQARGEPVTMQQTLGGWYEEVYAPAIAGIRKNDLLAKFPNRTEADLFVWAWQNNRDLEEMALSAEPSMEDAQPE